MNFRRTLVSAFFASSILTQFAFAADSMKSRTAATEISSKSAEEIALKAAPGKVIEVEHEKHSGVSVYAVEIQTADGLREVTLEAKDGKILSNVLKSQHDSDDDKETSDK